MEEKPKLVRRRENRNSTMKSGRTIGERREKIETANERMIARQKDKRKNHFRIFFVSVGFLVMAIVLAGIYFVLFEKKEAQPIKIETEIYEPTIDIIDENATADSNGITSRMKDYIGQAESDFRTLGYQPVKATVPSGSIREVDFYLDGYNGYIKMIIDRGTAVSVEDADRMLRYLVGQGITDFSYIDVRIPGKAYWK